MNATGWFNGAAATCAISLAVWLGAVTKGSEATAAASGHQAPPSATDATGHLLVIKPFHRIVSGSAVADFLLAQLCEPDRVVAFTAYGAASPVGYLYAGKPQVRSVQDVETILSLKPDLFITNNIGPTANLAPLRSNSVEVFDLGEMRGLSTFLSNVRTVAALVGHPERGERFAEGFARRFDRVAAGLDSQSRKRGLYISDYGGQLFGGTAGTSYHDVLVHAGLIDAAAEKYANWPQYSPGQVLELDPDVLVTKPGMKDLLCHSFGLNRLKACATGRVVEVPDEIIEDAGALMLDAAEQINDQVYGRSHER